MQPVSSRKLERVAGVLAVICLAMMALLAGKPSFTNASRPPRGITDPAIALEVARSLGDVDLILGEAPSPDREVMRIKQYVDVGFIASITGLFMSLAWLLTRQGTWGRIAGRSCFGRRWRTTGAAIRRKRRRCWTN